MILFEKHNIIYKLYSKFFLYPFFVLLFLFNSLVVLADPNLRFKHLYMEDGVSNNTIVSILQDSYGYIWFGTNDGLNRYDGRSFKIFSHDSRNKNSLQQNFVQVIFEDSEKNLWIGTDGGGLSLFNREKENFKNYLHNPENENSLPHNSVISIVQDERGYFWIGTLGGGLSRFNSKTGHFKNYQIKGTSSDLISDGRVWDIEYFKEKLYIATYRNGLMVFDIKNEKFHAFKDFPYNYNYEKNKRLYSVCIDKKNNLWFASKNALQKYNLETRQYIDYSKTNKTNEIINNRIQYIYESPTGKIWLGSWGEGLILYDSSEDKFISYKHEQGNPFSLSHDRVRTIYEDFSGTLWVGTWGEGINKYHPDEHKFVSYSTNTLYKNSISHNYVYAIKQDSKGRIWIGTLKGLDRFNNENGKFYSSNVFRNSFRGKSVRCIIESKDGTLWFATNSDGLYSYKSGKMKSYKNDSKNPDSISSNKIFTIYEDKKGVIWVGTRSGLDQYDKKNDQFIRYSHSLDDSNSISNSRGVTAIIEDDYGYFWIGTENGGLNRFDRSKNSFRHYLYSADNPLSINHNTINSLFLDKKGRLWIATAGGGFDLYNRNYDIFMHHTETDGLASNYAYSIVEDKNNFLWINTNKGLSRYDISNGIFRNFDVNDGLPGNMLTVAAEFCDNGEILFGSYKGLGRFLPSSITESSFHSPVVITGFRKFGKPFLPGGVLESIKSIDLSYKDDYFTLEYAALNYINSDKTQYAYMLEGFDRDWIYANKRRQASYTNLNGGNYTFKIKATNSDGVWNKESRNLDISITSPPWKRWWAYTIYILTLLGIVFAYISYKNRSHQREMAIKQRFLEASQRFVPNEFLEHLGRKEITDVQLGDCIEREMSVLFSDLRSFTSISEKMTPEENFVFLNDYLNAMAPIVRSNSGFIDKFIGDAIM